MLGKGAGSQDPDESILARRRNKLYQLGTKAVN
jgi:hypothetical protein